MKNTFDKMITGYKNFREKYTKHDASLMTALHEKGQSPKIMVIACSDSRVDPAILLQCDPGDLFVVRNIANIVPPYEKDCGHHGTSAAIEFAVKYLDIKHLIILGHSGCAGVRAKIKDIELDDNDFIDNWINQIPLEEETHTHHPDECAKQSLLGSYKNCLSFPWIKSRLDAKTMKVHLWFLELSDVTIHHYDFEAEAYTPLV